MQHANKLMLVDPAAYNAAQPSQLRLKNSDSDLDAEIKRVLDSQFPDDVKVGLYAQTIRRFRYLSDGTTQRTTQTFADERLASLKDDVVNSLPPTDQYKARRIWRHIDGDADVEWSDAGQLIYRKSLVPNSSAFDLFQHIFKKSTGDAVRPPDGSSEFVQSLLKSNAPLDILPNPKRFAPPRRGRKAAEKRRPSPVQPAARRRKFSSRDREITRAQSWESL